MTDPTRLPLPLFTPIDGRRRRVAAALCALLVLAACGGSDGDAATDVSAATPAPSAPPASSAFTRKANWSVQLPASGQSVCYDFDASTESAACSGANWDLKLTSGGRSASLSTNSGPSGPGKGGAFGSPFEHTWTELQAWSSATVSPTSGAIPATLYFADSAKSVFTGTNDIQSAAFEYSLKQDNRLYPTYRVFVITTDSANADASGATAPVYAVQLVGYYGGSTGTTSGYVSLQWVDRASPSSVRTATVDARNGWAYFDLASGTVTSETGTWQLAFNRYNVKLNGGLSGTGKTAGFVGRTPDGLYDANGAPVVAAFEAATPASTQPLLTAGDLKVPATASAWVKDGIASQLSPAYTGTFPSALDYGWFTYHPSAASAAAAGLPATAHLLQANPQRGTLLRSGEGTSYARFRLAGIAYANPQDSASAQTWTFEFDVQP